MDLTSQECFQHFEFIYENEIERHGQRVELVDDGRTMSSVLNFMTHDRTGFLCNLPTVFDAFKARRLYTVMMNAAYPCPCFMVVSEDGKVEILWVHRNFRRNGMGTLLVSHDSVRKKTIDNALSKSVPFWKTSGFEILKISNNDEV